MLKDASRSRRCRGRLARPQTETSRSKPWTPWLDRGASTSEPPASGPMSRAPRTDALHPLAPPSSSPCLFLVPLTAFVPPSPHRRAAWVICTFRNSFCASASHYFKAFSSVPRSSPFHISRCSLPACLPLQLRQQVPPHILHSLRILLLCTRHPPRL